MLSRITHIQLLNSLIYEVRNFDLQQWLYPQGPQSRGASPPNSLKL